ncbi:MAG: M20/M25/M40 family metallo-hydrolase [Rhodothermales bacterium]
MPLRSARNIDSIVSKRYRTFREVCLWSLLFCLWGFSSPTLAQDQALEALRSAQADTSTAMHTVRMLSDVFGPRLMGTPAYRQATDWAADQLQAWGADRVELDPFHDGQRGWETVGHSVEMIAPTYARLRAHPLAYTAGTGGTVEGEAVLVDRPEDIETYRSTLAGKVVLMGWTYEPPSPPTHLMWRRYTDEEIAVAEANPDPNDRLLGYHARRPIQHVLRLYADRKAEAEEFFRVCSEEGVLAVMQSSSYPLGILHVDNNGFTPTYSRTGDFTPLASFVIAKEAFGRMVRLLEMGRAPTLRVHSDVRFYEEPTYNVNVLSDLEGTDLKNELVIIGGHLDGHPAGTAAADNAVGVAAAMEALRLLQRAGLQPRRTIRVALWGGEEQGGFHGSLGYVTERVGDLFTGEKKEEYDQISAVLNLDNGAGRIRGIYAMGNEKAAEVFRELFAPFRTDSAAGDGAVTIQNANQTDHELFDALNVPAFQLIQDPLGYIPFQHHTDLDVLDYVPEEDLRHNALVLAYLAYGLAQRDEMVLCKPYTSIQPSLDGEEAFRLEGFEEASEVHLVGDFNNWNMFGTPMRRTSGGWVIRLDLPRGRYLYKFIVDGMWTNDPQTPEDELATDGKGHGGLTVRVVE